MNAMGRFWWAVAVFVLMTEFGETRPRVKRNERKLRRPSPEEEAGLVEGDMNIEPDDGFRSAVKQERYWWPNGRVPYKFSEKALVKFSKDKMKNISLAMEGFEKTTCIRFIPHTNEQNYLIITGGRGCSSNVGRIRNRGLKPNETYGQKILLGENCFGIGTIMHEMMHTLGFYHEQSRWDRDEYVKIQTQFIIQGKLKQFRIYDRNRAHTELGAPYDYGSIMHYPRHSFAMYVGEDTILPIKPGVEIGQRRGLSTIDIWKINKLYNCPDFSEVTLPPKAYVTPSKPYTPTPTPPSRTSDDFACSFDYGTSCGMSDSMQSDLDWIRKNHGPTLTKTTGPEDDVTGDGGYLYVESTMAQPGQKAYILMPYLNPTPGSCLKFWYHMSGETTGNLVVFTRDYTGQEQQVFKLSGDQGKEWKRAVVTVANDKSFQIIFESEITSDLGYGDVAIDEIKVLEHSKLDGRDCGWYAKVIRN